MADLKAGSTVGGLPIWHQGTMPLVPAGNSLTYNGYKVYTVNDKPQASDNDFVSKADGGKYLNEVEFGAGIKISPTFSGGNSLNGLYSGDGDGNQFTKCNMDLVSWYGVGIRSSQGSNGRTVVWNARTGDQSNKGSISADGQVISNQPAPTASNHLTRKDYVDSGINNVTNLANAAVKRSGDTMTGSLTAPFFISQRAAASANEVTILSQVVVKGTIIDFGTY